MIHTSSLQLTGILMFFNFDVIDKDTMLTTVNYLMSVGFIPCNFCMTSRHNSVLSMLSGVDHKINYDRVSTNYRTCTVQTYEVNSSFFIWGISI